jgi:uncharacterized protein with PQ loop repeat
VSIAFGVIVEAVRAGRCEPMSESTILFARPIRDPLVKSTAWLTVVLGCAAVVIGLAMLGHSFVEQLKLPGVDELIASAFSLKVVVGFLAGFGTTFAALPDLIVMLKRRSSQGMNPRMAGIMGAFQLLWIWYGVLIASNPVIIWNIIAVVTNLLVVCSYLYFSRLEQKASGQVTQGFRNT